MKKATLQTRIEKNLYTKSGTLARKYEDVIYLLKNPGKVMRPIYWCDRGRSLHDSHENLEHGLAVLGVDYTTGNDAPRGGMNGYFVKLTAKGKRQVREFANV